MLAKDIMTTDVACCRPDTSLRTAAQLMRDKDCGCLPVMADKDDKRLAGLITDRDLVCRAMAEGLDPLVTTVQMVMSSPVEMIGENATEEECIHKLADKRIRRLVVVDERGTCTGIITQGDIARTASPPATGDLVKEISQPTPLTQRAGAGASMSAPHAGGQRER
jgi:CBS domain-containing protein